MGITKEYVCGICGWTYATLEERNKCETECLNEQKKQKAKAEKIAKAIPTNSDREIKIEWAKDYFGSDAVVVVRTDNVAQLCYYFRYVRDFVSKAKALGIGNPELSDDTYALLYEKEMSEEFCDGQDFRIFCMEKASAIMRAKNYVNAFKVTGRKFDESTWMWHAKKTWPRCSGYHGEAEHRGQWLFCNRELPLTFQDFQAYKKSLYKFNSYKDTRTDCFALSDFDSNSSKLTYGFMPKAMKSDRPMAPSEYSFETSFKPLRVPNSIKMSEETQERIKNDNSAPTPKEFSFNGEVVWYAYVIVVFVIVAIFGIVTWSDLHG